MAVVLLSVALRAMWARQASIWSLSSAVAVAVSLSPWAASLANLSALSLPSAPAWDGVHLIVTSPPLSLM